MATYPNKTLRLDTADATAKDKTLELDLTDTPAKKEAMYLNLADTPASRANYSSNTTTTPSTTPTSPNASSATTGSIPKVDASTVTNSKSLEDYGTYKRSEYQKTDDQLAAEAARDAWQRPGEYESKYGAMIDEVMNRILNRDKFSYDLNGDALYQQYKDQYINQGQMAMMDTMGQAAAMTGGYGNSYAQSVGQQTYQGYLQQLNDKVPELYKLALDQYNREGEEMYNQYGLLTDRDATDYGRYRDTVADSLAERDYLTEREDTAYNRGYQEHSDMETAKQNQANADRSLEYQLDSDAIANNQWLAGFDEGVRQFDESMAFDREQFETQNQQWQADFDQRVHEINENLKLEIRKIKEDERNGKISREIAQKEIALKEEEAKRAEREAQADLEYKYAALEASTTGSYTDNKGNKVTAPKSSSSGSGGSGGSAKSLTPSEWKDVEETCSMYGDNYSGLQNYINGLVNRGYISEDEAADLWDAYGNEKTESPGSSILNSVGSFFNSLIHTLN